MLEIQRCITEINDILTYIQIEFLIFKNCKYFKLYTVFWIIYSFGIASETNKTT